MDWVDGGRPWPRRPKLVMLGTSGSSSLLDLILTAVYYGLENCIASDEQREEVQASYLRKPRAFLVQLYSRAL